MLRLCKYKCITLNFFCSNVIYLKYSSAVFSIVVVWFNALFALNISDKEFYDSGILTDIFLKKNQEISVTTTFYGNSSISSKQQQKKNKPAIFKNFKYFWIL